MVERTVVAGIGTIPIVGGPLSSWIFDYRSEQAIEDAEFRLRLRLGRAEDSIRELGQEFNQRMLSLREDLRVGKVLASAITTIDERLTQGETLRDDGFFDSDESGRSDADEVGEHILLKCQREPEEKKLHYMAHLLASLAFTDSVDSDMAHQLVKVAEQLTYRQFCLLRLVSAKDDYNLRNRHYVGQTLYPNVYTILSDVRVMSYLHGLVGNETLIMADDDVVPSSLRLSGYGKMFYYLARLQEIPDEDIVLLAKVLTE